MSDQATFRIFRKAIQETSPDQPRQDRFDILNLGGQLLAKLRRHVLALGASFSSRFQDRPSLALQKEQAHAACITRSATTKSYATCKFIQNRADVPSRRPSRMAVSAVMPRSPFRMAVMRLGDTAKSRAIARADKPSGSRYSVRSISPGVMGSSLGSPAAKSVLSTSSRVIIAISSVVIGYLNAVGVTFQPNETHPPLFVDANGMLASAVIFQSLQMVTGRLQIFQRNGGIKDQQLAVSGPGNVLGKTFFRARAFEKDGRQIVVKGLNHLYCVPRRVTPVNPKCGIREKNFLRTPGR